MTEIVTQALPSDSGLTMTTPRRSHTILVVEDHADTRELLRYVLESRRYEVSEATDGAEAIRLAEKILPDLILMDTSLSTMDGIEVTRHIRGAGGNRNVPIVFLSGHAQPQARALALASGGNDYLVKPISLEELQRVIECQLSGALNRPTVTDCQSAGEQL